MRSPAGLAFVASTAGLGGLAAQAAMRGEPGLAVIGALGWGVVATTGVCLPWLEMFGRIVCRGPTGSARVALTFDDGPHPVTTRRVLEALAPTRHRATFFMLGEKARRHPDVVREIHAGGHALGVHGEFHDRLHSFRMPWSVRDQIVRAEDVIEAATGMRPRFFRPPPRPHEPHHRTRRAPCGCHVDRLVVTRLRRHPLANPRRRRGAHRPSAHRRRNCDAPRRRRAR
jgi:peptidoglycan-N-acetylglucosamine deacetylase